MSADVIQLVVDQDSLLVAGQEAVRCALANVDEPIGIVVVAFSRRDFAVRTAHDEETMTDFEMYARVAAVLERQKMNCIE